MLALIKVLTWLFVYLSMEASFNVASIVNVSVPGLAEKLTLAPLTKLSVSLLLSAIIDVPSTLNVLNTPVTASVLEICMVLLAV